MDGEFFIDLLDTGERYVLQQPPVNVSGIIWGQQLIEIYDDLILTCKECRRHSVITFSQGVSFNKILMERLEMH